MRYEVYHYNAVTKALTYRGTLQANQLHFTEWELVWNMEVNQEFFVSPTQLIKRIK